MVSSASSRGVKAARRVSLLRRLTQEQTARILHVSQVQISRLERRSLQKLRELLTEE